MRVIALALLLLTQGVVCLPLDAGAAAGRSCLFGGTSSAPCPHCVLSRHHGHAGGDHPALAGDDAPLHGGDTYCSMRCAAAAQVLAFGSSEAPGRSAPPSCVVAVSGLATHWGAAQPGTLLPGRDDRLSLLKPLQRTTILRL